MPEIERQLQEIVKKNNVLKNENRKIYLLNKPSEEVSSYFELNSFIKLGIIKIWDEEITL